MNLVPRNSRLEWLMQVETFLPRIMETGVDTGISNQDGQVNVIDGHRLTECDCVAESIERISIGATVVRGNLGPWSSCYGSCSETEGRS